MVQTISPPIGDRGQLSNRTNLLTYNVTSTDSAPIGVVTERINGVTVATKNLNSGQNTTLNITQAQWDAIPYGKYQNNNAARNTIEIVTSAATFRYTFEKWIDNTADILSSVKAIKDSKDYYLPSAKKTLVEAANAKGASLPITSSFEAIALALNQIPNNKVVKGYAITHGLPIDFKSYSNITQQLYPITIDLNIIGFQPDFIVCFASARGDVTSVCYNANDFYYINDTTFANVLMKPSFSGTPFDGKAIIDSNSIKLPYISANSGVDYIAIKGGV